MSGLTSVDGLISGLNTSEIIDSLMAIERRSVTLLEAKRERYNTELLSYQTIEAKLLAIRGSAEALARTATFDARTTTSSDATIITATAAARSAAGTYDLTVASLARSHQIASQGFADIDTTSVGTGTFTIEVNGITTELAIDASNCTLDGVRNAVNRAGIGVQATIINDGGATHPYRLLLTSTDTGKANAISVSSSLSGGSDVVFDANSLTGPTAAAANFYSGTASSGGTYTGASGKTYTVRIVQAGGIDEATFQVSEDGGQTWGSERTLSSTIDVYDDLNGSDLGAQMSFTEGEFGAGDEVAFGVRLASGDIFSIDDDLEAFQYADGSAGENYLVAECSRADRQRHGGGMDVADKRHCARQGLDGLGEGLLDQFGLGGGEVGDLTFGKRHAAVARSDQQAIVIVIAEVLVVIVGFRQFQTDRSQHIPESCEMHGFGVHDNAIEIEYNRIHVRGVQSQQCPVSAVSVGARGFCVLRKSFKKKGMRVAPSQLPIGAAMPDLRCDSRIAVLCILRLLFLAGSRRIRSR